jgi:hypothetical protein
MRLLTRVLFVLGGTVAATALGWLISSATASAATLPDLNVPGTHAASVAPVTGLLDGITLPAGPASTMPKLPPPPSAAGVAGELRTAVSQLGSRVPVARAVPVAPLTAQPPTSLSAPAGQSGPVSGPAPARSLPTVTTVAPVPAAPATVVRSPSYQAAALVPPVPQPIPTMPNPAPWSPVTVPAAPGGSVGGSTGTGGLGLVDTSGTFPVPGLDIVRVIPVTVPLGRVTAGKQPGITPD